MNINSISDSIIQSNNSFYISDYLKNQKKLPVLSKINSNLPRNENLNQNEKDVTKISQSKQSGQINLEEYLYPITSIQEEAKSMTRQLDNVLKNIKSSIKRNDLRDFSIKFINFKYKLMNLVRKYENSSKSHELNGIINMINEKIIETNKSTIAFSYEIIKNQNKENKLNSIRSSSLHVSSLLVPQMDSILNKQKESISKFDSLLEKSYLLVPNEYKPYAVKPYVEYERIEYNEVKFLLENTKKYSIYEKIRKEKEEKVIDLLNRRYNHTKLDKILDSQIGNSNFNRTTIGKKRLKIYFLISYMISKLKLQFLFVNDKKQLKNIMYIKNNIHQIHQFLTEFFMYSYKQAAIDYKPVSIKDFSPNQILSERNKKVFHQVNNYILYLFNGVSKTFDYYSMNIESMGNIVNYNDNPLNITNAGKNKTISELSTQSNLSKLKKIVKFMDIITKSNIILPKTLFSKYELEKLDMMVAVLNEDNFIQIKNTSFQKFFLFTIKFILLYFINEVLIKDKSNLLVCSIVYWIIIDYMNKSYNSIRQKDVYDQRNKKKLYDNKSKKDMYELYNEYTYDIPMNLPNDSKTNKENENYSRIFSNFLFKRRKIEKDKLFILNDVNLIGINQYSSLIYSDQNIKRQVNQTMNSKDLHYVSIYGIDCLEKSVLTKKQLSVYFHIDHDLNEGFGSRLISKIKDLFSLFDDYVIKSNEYLD